MAVECLAQFSQLCGEARGGDAGLGVAQVWGALTTSYCVGESTSERTMRVQHASHVSKHAHSEQVSLRLPAGATSLASHHISSRGLICSLVSLPPFGLPHYQISGTYS